MNYNCMLKIRLRSYEMELGFYDLFTSYEMELGFYDLFTSYEMEVKAHVHVQIKNQLWFHELKIACYN